MNETGIKKLILSGEGIAVEFKKCRNSLSRNVFETICGFLNRNGGDLFLGVDDSGTITGIDAGAVEQVKKDLVTGLNNPQRLNPTFYLTPEDWTSSGKWRQTC